MLVRLIAVHGACFSQIEIAIGKATPTGGENLETSAPKKTTAQGVETSLLNTTL